MSATPVGENWDSSWTTDGTLAGSTTITNSSNASSSAISVQFTPPAQSDFLALNLAFTFPNNSPSGVVTLSLLQATQAGYQATTDPSVYSWTFTPTQNATNEPVWLIPVSQIAGGGKINVANASGYTMSNVALYYKFARGNIAS